MAAMKFGWLTLALSPSPDEDAVRIDDQIAQVCAAEALGFNDVWLTEHYFTGESVYNDALLFASALTQRTTRIRIGFAVIQMPFHHPIRLAVQLALLERAWHQTPLVYEGKYFNLRVPELRPKPVQQPGPPLWRCVISATSSTECGRLG